MRSKAKNKAAILSAATAGAMLCMSHGAQAQTLIANWSADTYTSPNWVDPISGTTGTGFGTNTLIAAGVVNNPFGGMASTHAALDVSAGGFQLPQHVAFPPAGSSTFTVAAVFDPTSAQVTAGAAWQVAQLLGYDIGGAGQPDFTLGFGGASGASFIAGGGVFGGASQVTGGDYTLTSKAVALNTVHTVILQEEDPGAATNKGYIDMYVDGSMVGQVTGVTVPAMLPQNSGNTMGLAGTATNNGGLHLPGIVGTIQVYDDSSAVTNPLTLSSSLAAAYNGGNETYAFSVASGSISAPGSYANGKSPVADANAQIEISNGGNAQIASTDTVGVADFFVGDANSGTGVGSVTQTGGVVTATSGFIIGNGHGNGSYTITGGNLNYSGSALLELQGSAATPAVLNVGGGVGTATVLVNTGGNNIQTSIGEGAGASGILNILPGGTYQTSAGELWVGNNSGVGVLNISGGTLAVNNWLAAGRVQGTGTINLMSGQLIKTGGGDIDIGGDQSGSTGYLIQTGGSLLSSGSPLLLGESGGDNGTYTASGTSTAAFSVFLDGSSGNGVMNVSGNAIVTANGGNSVVAQNGPSNAVLNISGNGSVTTSGDLQVGNNGGVGIVNISGGSLTVGGWLAPGRASGNNNSTGTIYLSGGSLIKPANSSPIDIAGDGAGGTAYFYQTGGNVSAPSSELILAENGANGNFAADYGVYNISGTASTANYGEIAVGLGGTGIMNITGGAAVNGSSVAFVGHDGGSNGTLTLSGSSTFSPQTLVVAHFGNSTGLVNLNGGTLTTYALAYGNGNATLNLNGTTLQATNNNSDYLSATEAVPLAFTSPLTINTQGANIGVQQSLSGTGPLTKGGAGTLTLAASNSYSGNTVVNAGTIAVANAKALGGGTAVLNNGGSLALTVQSTSLQSFSGAYLNNQSNVFTPQISGNDNAVTLTDPQNSIANSIYLGNTVTIDDTKGFNASFVYNHASQGPEETGADGIVFVLQAVSPNSVGGAGGSLGYNNGTGFGQSLAAAIDLFLDRVDIGMGNGSAGVLNNTVENSSPGISQTTSSNVSVIYTPGAGGAGTFTITMTNQSGGVIATDTQTNVDASALLGGSAGGATQAFVGFTGSTGGVNDLQSVSDFSFNNNGTTLGYAAVNISNTVMVSDSASATIQLAPTAGFSSGQVGPIVLGNKSNLALTIGASPFAGVTHGVLTTTSVTQTVTGSGTLDIANNALDITGQSLTSVNGLVKTAINGGAWNGSGITSSTAAADTTHLTAVGVILNSITGLAGGAALYGSGAGLGLFEGANPSATDVLVKYTYFGDANLDGKVDASDYSRIDSAFGTGATGWYNGDFNYDGVINGSDYTLIDNAFNRQTISLADQVATATAQLGGGSVVPEPATLGLLAIGAAGLLGRRRRHH